jgi:hypothetical protein
MVYKNKIVLGLCLIFCLQASSVYAGDKVKREYEKLEPVLTCFERVRPHRRFYTVTACLIGAYGVIVYKLILQDLWSAWILHNSAH